MSFDWLHYYNLAQELAGVKPQQPVNEEAKLRAAISRAYYAAHWTARNFLKSEYNFEPRKGYEHGDIWRELYKGSPQYPAEHVKIGSYLEALYDYRRKADYESRFDDVGMAVKLALQYARRIIEGLKPKT